jgi:hypothetical protein
MKKDYEEDDENEAVVECSECGDEISEGENVFACEECNEIFCEECGEEHRCIGLDVEENQSCYNCGSCNEEMYFCGICNNYFCEDCKEEHEKEETKKKMTSYSYEDYVKGEVIDKIK